MFARSIAAAGTGHAGLTTGSRSASLGHRVACADIDTTRVDQPATGEVGIRGPGSAELAREGQVAGHPMRDAPSGRAGGA
ncbi:hypothetical protein [Pseudonocardia acidicola]|uniref:UDP-glucose/GDP-mannose dehydrogenase N-terminal domain-containing protein n=1 Tax=Pseudonocardia acidicola TaxID=2724939 RepID=A0ABX1S9Z7_9PSEU|nr:hypothetical protein [Pseudonocardia acidicola]